MKVREVNEFSQDQKLGTGRAGDLGSLKIVIEPLLCARQQGYSPEQDKHGSCSQELQPRVEGDPQKCAKDPKSEVQGVTGIAEPTDGTQAF